MTTRGDMMVGERVEEALEGRRDEGGREDSGGSDAAGMLDVDAEWLGLSLSTKKPDLCIVPLSVIPRGRVTGRDDGALDPKVPDVVPEIAIWCGDGCWFLLLFKAVSERFVKSFLEGGSEGGKTGGKGDSGPPA